MMLRHPQLLLLVVPALAAFVWSLSRRSRIPVSPVNRMKAAGRTWRVRFWWLPELLSFTLLAVTAVLLAGPERVLDPDAGTAEGLAIVIAFDRSSSMGAIIPYGADKMRRIDGVKQVTRDFLTQRKNDQFALVSFARYPETNTPLTGNKSILLDFLDLIEVPETEDEDGTAIGDALVLSAAHLGQKTGGKNGIVILLTDGQNNRGEKTPEEGAAIASESGATVYTIGLGGDGYVMQDTPFGPQPVGVPVTIDEQTLSAIARKTGGKYYRADGLGDLAGFYQDIAKRETSKLEQLNGQKTELNLGGGLLSLLVLLVLLVAVRYYILRRRDS
jgi:Mg-chelatase subunit ChlD